MKKIEGTIAIGMVVIFIFTTGFVFGGSYEQGREKKKAAPCKPVSKEKVVEVEKEVIIDNTDNESINYCWIQRNELQDELVDKNKDLKKTEADLLFLETLVKKERSYKDNRIDRCAEELDSMSKSRGDCRNHESELSKKYQGCLDSLEKYKF